jgi:hypothetical protein
MIQRIGQSSPWDMMTDMFWQNGEGISGPMSGGGAAPAVQNANIPSIQPTGPKVMKINAKNGSSGGGMGGLPLGAMSNFFGGSGGAASGGASSAGGASSGLSGMLGALNPVTAIPVAAIAGATSLSADSAAAGNGAGIENWLGPLYNIPEAISRGDWGDVMKDGATGPIGAIYNVANGEDPLKSFMNSFGPAGQVPWLIGSGQMPYSGGNTSKNFMSAFQGRGV